MNLDDLSFGVYKEISPNIVEVVIHEGVELTEDMMDLAEKAIQQGLREPGHTYG